jgi:hypothetical protein
MARFTITELDRLSEKDIHSLCAIDAIRVELQTGVSQRSTMVCAHSGWVRTLEQEALESADWNSSIRSNFDLYAELRINGVAFDRIPPAPIFMIDDVEEMTDEQIIAISEEGGLELDMSDIRRDVMLRAHAAWVETLSQDLREAYQSGSASRSNWELYSEMRINGIPPLRPTLVAAAL